MALALIICVDFRLRWNQIDSLNVPSYGDFLMYIFAGMKEFGNSPMEQFQPGNLDSGHAFNIISDSLLSVSGLDGNGKTGISKL